MEYFRIWFFQTDLQGVTRRPRSSPPLCFVIVTSQGMKKTKRFPRLVGKGPGLSFIQHLLCQLLSLTSSSHRTPQPTARYNSQKTKVPWTSTDGRAGTCTLAYVLPKSLLCVTHPTTQPGCLHGLERWSQKRWKPENEEESRVWLESGRT